MKGRVTKTSLFWGLVGLAILFIVLDVLMMLFGGQYLAWGIVPPLPEDRVKVRDSCLVASADRCRNIEYVTAQSPESIIAHWSDISDLVEVRPNLVTGENAYVYDACNQGFWGYQYAVLHETPDPGDGAPCARLVVAYDNSEKTTHIRIGLSWTNCLHIIKKYAPYGSWINRPCNDG